MRERSTSPIPGSNSFCKRCGAQRDPILPPEAPCPVCKNVPRDNSFLSGIRPEDRQSILAAVAGIGAVVCIFLVVLLLEEVSSLPMAAAFQTPVATPATASFPAVWHGVINKVPLWVTVIPRGHTISLDARQHEPWWRWGNTSTDAYLFAASMPDRVLLILSFDTLADGTPQARIYVNDVGSKPLDYSIDGGELNVHTANGHPYLVMRPDHGAWLVDGEANYNLTLSLFDASSEQQTDRPPDDDTPDTILRVGGRRPGIPDWQTQELLYDPSPDRAYMRFSAGLRMANSPPFKVATPVMPNFPYLGIGDGKIDWFEENPSPLYLDATRPEFHVFPFTGFETGGSYEFSSLSHPPNPDFESPYAFYNFDPTTRHAQLLVRSESFPAGDEFGPAPTNLQRSSFRYSWTRQSSDQWTYSLHVGGSFPYTQQIQIGDVKVWGVPPSELPTWVTSKSWPVVTFVEAVDGYPGSEGIYFYTAQGPAPWPWLSGASNRPPDFMDEPYLMPDVTLSNESGEGLPPNFRGEYIADNAQPIGLYLSPIDNRVHLTYAQGGVWNLGPSLVLREHNLTNGRYVDAWTLERVPKQPTQDKPPRALPGTVEQALYALGKYLVYSGPEGVRILEVPDPVANLPLPVPTDSASWREFNQQTAPFLTQPRDPHNLASWLSAFRGETLTFEGAQVKDVRASTDTFQFELDLQPGFRVHGDPVLDWQSLGPGRYAVSFDRGFTIQPLTSPGVVLSVRLSPDQYLQTGEPVQLRVEAASTGRDDRLGATLRVLTRHDGKSQELARRVVDVLSDHPARTALIWQPNAAGRWDVEVTLEDPHGEIVAQRSHQATVASGSTLDARTVLELSTSSGWEGAVFLILIGASIVAWAVLRPIFGSAMRDATTHASVADNEG